jgi:hypothetical protein
MMLWGMSLVTFTVLHAVLSLVGIGTGLVVMCGLLQGRPRNRSTALFLATTVAAAVTGFEFQVDRRLPSHVIGTVSIVLLAAAIIARYGLDLRGAWRRIYILCAVAALYLNIFVRVVQTFRTIPALRAIAPEQTEPLFLIAHLVVLTSFIAPAIVASQLNETRHELIP